MLKSKQDLAMFGLDFFISFLKLLNSDDSPTPIALGMATGVLLALTPLAPHTLVVLFFLFMFNISFGGMFLTLATTWPLSFLLVPIFNKIGYALLVDIAPLHPFWAKLINLPFMAFFNFQNTLTLGSIVFSLLIFIPVTFIFRFLIVKYRVTIKEKIVQSAVYKWMMRSTLLMPIVKRIFPGIA
jgi:uncharacterized protein (TIGR03546 family)